MKPWITVAIAECLIGVLSVGCARKAPPEQSSSSSSTVVALDESNFDRQVGSGVVLVDFWASWCGPCKVQGPIVEQVAGQVEGKATVTKVDVDAVPAVAQRFNIRSIPTLVVFKNGKPGRQFVGVTDAQTLVSAITSAIDSQE